MIQSGAEEIVDRCYLYQKLRRRYRWPVIAIAVNALIFMALHMGNPGVTKLGLLQVFLFGVLASLLVYYWDSLWAAIWTHTAWNFSLIKYSPAQRQLLPHVQQSVSDAENHSIGRNMSSLMILMLHPWLIYRSASILLFDLPLVIEFFR